jgi:hypothetical protein
MRKTPELALLAQAFFAFKQVLSIDFFRVIAERSCVIPQTPLAARVPVVFWNGIVF